MLIHGQSLLLLIVIDCLYIKGKFLIWSKLILCNAVFGVYAYSFDSYKHIHLIFFWKVPNFLKLYLFTNIFDMIEDGHQKYLIGVWSIIRFVFHQYIFQE